MQTLLQDLGTDTHNDQREEPGSYADFSLSETYYALLTLTELTQPKNRRYYMKKRFVSLLGILVVTLIQSSLFTVSKTGANTFESAVGSESYEPVQSKEFKRSVEIDSGADFILETDKGSVLLTSWDRNQIEISARIDAPKNESEDYGKLAVEGARIDVTGDKRMLTVRSNFDAVPYKNNTLGQSKTLPDIHYEIRAPRNLNLRLDVDRSKLEVRAFTGKMRLQADRSPLIASDLEGEVHITIDRGSVELANLRGSLKVEADRTSGQVRALRLSGDSSIEIDRGTLDLGLSESQGLNIVANMTKRSGFNSDFAVSILASGKGVDKKRFEGTINGGGSKLLIESDRGTVNLKRE